MSLLPVALDLGNGSVLWMCPVGPCPLSVRAGWVGGEGPRLGYTGVVSFAQTRTRDPAGAGSGVRPLRAGMC